MTLWALYFLMIFNAEATPPASDAVPFWKSKQKVYQRISEGREIIVTASSVKNPSAPPKNLLNIHGGGHIEKPIKEVFREAQNYSELPKLTDYVTRAEFDSARQHLILDLAAFGHKATLGILLKVIETESQKQIQFVVDSGPIKGLEGKVDFLSLTPTKTEVGLRGHFAYDKFPIPKVFAEFGLEFIIQRMALKIRQSLEAKK